ncbi:MAG TPA: hypothetical protein VNT51_11285 [Miltoncostaeaceae bacterium]|nr:hypothetical protein [Miltoncostaeaceae bacterium]
MSTRFRAGPWACRSLRGAGFRVVGADGLGRSGRSLQCPKPLRVPSAAREPAAFRAAVAELCRCEGIAAVLPVSEDATRVLAMDPPDLSGAVLVGPTRPQFAALCDKAALAAAAGFAGVDHPETVVVPPGGAPEAWPPLPSIVKPGMLGEDAPVAAAVAVDTPAERRRALEDVWRAGATAIVQEFVTGRRWSVHGVRSGEGYWASAILVAASYPRTVGTTSFARCVTPPPGLLEATERLLALVDYRGPCSFNVIERDGRFLVHDVNLRLSSSIALTIHSGLDVPALAVAGALGLPAAGAPPRPGAAYVRLDGEGAALVDALRAGDVRDAATRAALIARAATADDHVLDPPVLEPFRLAESLRGQAERRARRVVRRVRASVRPGRVSEGAPAGS